MSKNSREMRVDFESELGKKLVSMENLGIKHGHVQMLFAVQQSLIDGIEGDCQLYEDSTEAVMDHLQSALALMNKSIVADMNEIAGLPKDTEVVLVDKQYDMI